MKDIVQGDGADQVQEETGSSVILDNTVTYLFYIVHPQKSDYGALVSLSSPTKEVTKLRKVSVLS